MSQLLTKIVQRPFFVQVRFRHPKKRLKYVDDLTWAAPLIEKYERPPPEPKEPTKLHVVYLIKPLRGRPYWEKEAASRLTLSKVHEMVVVKNIEEVNRSLATIKHLIRIIPMSFPYGYPESEDDFGHCYLRDNGEFVVQRRLEPAKVVTSDGDEKLRLDQKSLRKRSSDILQRYALSEEYFPAKYEYKYNEDCKEYRYKGNTNINSNRGWY